MRGQYAVQSQIQWHGLDISENMVLIEPVSERTGALAVSEILSAIDANASSTALILLSGVQYLTGQLLNMKEITAYAQSKGIVVGWDLAHAAGNVELSLHDWNVDFAVWCNYKYMNAGPGAIGSIFVHEKHGKVDRSMGIQGYRPRLAGWWGNEMSNRFAMEPSTHSNSLFHLGGRINSLTVSSICPKRWSCRVSAVQCIHFGYRGPYRFAPSVSADHHVFDSAEIGSPYRILALPSSRDWFSHV